MNLFDRVRHLKKMHEDGIYAGISPEDENLWAQGQLESWATKYTYPPKSYIQFAKEFDNMSLSFCRFYGPNASNVYFIEAFRVGLISCS
jgi:hypothetical protein